MIFRIAGAAALVLSCHPLAAQTGLQAPAAMLSQPAAEAPPECWLAHVQVQPPRRLGPVADVNFGEAYRPQAEAHVGAEHPTPERLRPCGSLPPAAGPAEATTRR